MLRSLEELKIKDRPLCVHDALLGHESYTVGFESNHASYRKSRHSTLHESVDEVRSTAPGSCLGAMMEVIDYAWLRHSGHCDLKVLT